MSRDEISNSTPTVGAPMRKTLGGGRVRAALSLGIVLGLGSVGTLAAWSDTATATSGEFKTAAIKLELGPKGGSSASYSFSALTKTGILPGATVEAALPVQNTGDLGFNYTVAAMATGNADVAGQISISVFGGTCTGTALGSGTLSTTTSTPLVTTARGPVAAAGTDNLCIRATALNGLKKAMQNQSINVTLTFTATSV